MDTRIVDVGNKFLPQIYSTTFGWEGIDKKFRTWNSVALQMDHCLFSSEEKAMDVLDTYKKIQGS